MVFACQRIAAKKKMGIWLMALKLFLLPTGEIRASVFIGIGVSHLKTGNFIFIFALAHTKKIANTNLKKIKIIFQLWRLAPSINLQ